MADEHVWHGGDLDEARRLFPDAQKPWIDLSTGINPVPYPVPVLAASVFHRLPAPGDLAALEATAAAAYEAADEGTVVAGPGTQVLINWLPRLRPTGRVAIVGPTYAEHAVAWRLGGHEVVETVRLDEPAEVLVVVNPNNPDGRVISREILVATADRLARHGGWLVVDEAFIDLEPTDSLIPALPPAAIVLRSFGKAYGLAGLRLGFGVAQSSIADALRRALGPWAVSGPAIAIGTQALADAGWRAQSAREREAAARRLDVVLSTAGRVTGGTRLFRLLETPTAARLFERLGRSGIWARRFAERPHHLRLRPPSSEAEWRRLESALVRDSGDAQP